LCDRFKITIGIKPKNSIFFISSSFNPLLGRSRYLCRCWAAIRLSLHPESSGMHSIVGRSMDWTVKDDMVRPVLLRHTHKPQKGP